MYLSLFLKTFLSKLVYLILAHKENLKKFQKIDILINV